MSGKPKDTWGGKRDGSGQPKKTLSISQLKEMLDKAEAWAKKHDGATVDDFVLAVIYGDIEYLYPNTIKDAEDVKSLNEYIAKLFVPLKDRLAAAKLWKDKIMIPVPEGGDTDRDLGPATYLPEEMPDTAKIVNIDDVRNLEPS